MWFWSQTPNSFLDDFLVFTKEKSDLIAAFFLEFSYQLIVLFGLSNGQFEFVKLSYFMFQPAHFKVLFFLKFRAYCLLLNLAVQSHDKSPACNINVALFPLLPVDFQTYLASDWFKLVISIVRIFVRELAGISFHFFPIDISFLLFCQ